MVHVWRFRQARPYHQDLDGEAAGAVGGLGGFNNRSSLLREETVLR